MSTVTSYFSLAAAAHYLIPAGDSGSTTDPCDCCACFVRTTRLTTATARGQPSMWHAAARLVADGARTACLAGLRGVDGTSFVFVSCLAFSSCAAHSPTFVERDPEDGGGPPSRLLAPHEEQKKSAAMVSLRNRYLLCFAPTFTCSLPLGVCNWSASLTPLDVPAEPVLETNDMWSNHRTRRGEPRQ